MSGGDEARALLQDCLDDSIEWDVLETRIRAFLATPAAPAAPAEPRVERVNAPQVVSVQRRVEMPDGPIPQLGTHASARDIVQTIALAMQRGYTPDEILDENSPIVERVWAEATTVRDAAPAAPAEPVQDLSMAMQQMCSDWGTYWRAPDAHGVNLTHAQAVELLEFALGVEVKIAAPPPVSVEGPEHLAPMPAPGLHFDERGVLVPAAPAEPVAGWRVVPVEPTLKMLTAGVAAESNAPTHVQERLTLYAYRAMLDAAPPPPPTEAEDAARCNGPEANALIDNELAARGWPSNPKNAARAGWEAAMKYRAARRAQEAKR